MNREESAEWKKNAEKRITRSKELEFWTAQFSSVELGTRDWNSTYHKYLQSNLWKEIREEALLRAGNACEECKIHYTTLEVHHLNYDRVGGKEKTSDLRVLCSICHPNEDRKREIRTEDNNDQAYYHLRVNNFADQCTSELLYFEEEEEMFLKYLYKKNLPRLQEDYGEMYDLVPDIDPEDDFYQEFRDAVISRNY
jgi:hypothetical protein